MHHPSRIDRHTRTRRHFLAWLAAAPSIAAIGCSSKSLGSALPAEPYGAEPLAPGEPDVSESAYNSCRKTSADAKGPYWEPGAPVRATRIAMPEEPGVRLLVEGRLLGPDCATPLAGYALDLWQADAFGNYYTAEDDYRLRGKVVTDGLGRYRFETVLPGRYGDAAGIRPAHIHVSFLSPGANVLLTTQLYFEGDPFLGQADYCTRDGTCNSSDPKRALSLRDYLFDPPLADGGDAGAPIAGKRTTFDAVLKRT